MDPFRVTPADFIRDVKALADSLDVQLDYLADHAHELRLVGRNGPYQLLGASDLKQFCREAAEAWRK